MAIEHDSDSSDSSDSEPRPSLQLPASLPKPSSSDDSETSDEEPLHKRVRKTVGLPAAAEAFEEAAAAVAARRAAANASAARHAALAAAAKKPRQPPLIERRCEENFNESWEQACKEPCLCDASEDASAFTAWAEVELANAAARRAVSTAQGLATACSQPSPIWDDDRNRERLRNEIRAAKVATRADGASSVHFPRQDQLLGPGGRPYAQTRSVGRHML